MGQINDFCGAQAIFESMIVPLMGKKGGKNLINKYTKVIKENKSLKTIYAYHEGLKENKTTDAKKHILQRHYHFLHLFTIMNI